VFPYRVGFGNLAVDPNTGCAVVSCHSTHGGLTIHPDLARDIAPGAGIFEYAEGDPTASGYQWPPLAVGQSGTIHVLSITAAYLIQYFRVSSWPTFETGVGGFVPDPGFPSQYIAASPVSQKVVAAWENENITPNVGWYRVSTDDGVTWGDPQQFDPPAAFGGDTVTTFHISSMNPYYDRNDRLHFLTAVSPIVRDTGYIIPAEIWHWCGENTPAWSKIHRATCDPANLQAAVGYNALYADRPTVCETDQGALIVAWEQFDSANVEPTTSFLRADIFLASSVDNGTTWSPPYKLTDAQTTSCRFPCMVDAMPPDDDMWLSYEIDQVAGFYIQSQGAATTNPIVVWHGQPDAIVEQAPARPTALGLSGPGVVRGDVTLRCMLPRAGHVSLDLFDAAGRPVARPLVGYRQAGDHTVRWDAGRVPSGVYLARLSDGRRVVSRKLTVMN
jgi:hypothetical protein